MIKKTVIYTDFDGNERTEDHYFHLNDAEVAIWLTQSGDYTLDKVLERLASEHNGRKIMEIFTDLLKRSYGVKSLDGRRFMKSEEATKEFMETEAFSQIFMELVTDAKKASDFVNGIIPKTMSDKVKKIMAENPEGIPANLRDYLPANNTTA